MTIIDQEINTLDGCVGSSGQLWEFTRYRIFESQNWFFWVLAKPVRLPTVGRPRRTLCGLAALRANYFFFPLAKTQSRKEIESTSRFLFLASPSWLSALVSCFLLLLIGCRRPLRLPYFASYSFFSFIFSQRPACGRQTQSRKEIVVR